MKNPFRFLIDVFSPHRTKIKKSTPTKNIINNNFQKIQAEIGKLQITTDILIEDTKNKEKASIATTQLIKEMDERLYVLEHRNRHPN